MQKVLLFHNKTLLESRIKNLNTKYRSDDATRGCYTCSSPYGLELKTIYNFNWNLIWRANSKRTQSELEEQQLGDKMSRPIKVFIWDNVARVSASSPSEFFIRRASLQLCSEFRQSFNTANCPVDRPLTSKQFVRQWIKMAKIELICRIDLKIEN